MVLGAIGDRGDLVVVGQSLGSFVAPLVAERRPVELLVLIDAMVPRPGETDWWAATGHPVEIGPHFDPLEVFLHDVPDSARAEAGDPAGPQSRHTDAPAVPAHAMARRADPLRAGATGPLLPGRLAAQRRA